MTEKQKEPVHGGESDSSCELGRSAGDGVDSATRNASRGERIGLLLGSLIFVVVVGEVLLRSFVSFAPLIQIGAGATQLDPRTVAAAFESDSKHIWRLKKNVTFEEGDHPLRGIVSNAQGLRDDSPVPTEKADNEVRILFLGDSVTFGWRIPWDETFAELSERALQEHFPGIEMRGINAGVPGYSLYQSWLTLVTEGLHHQPDLVVVSFGFNDGVTWFGLSDAQHHEHWHAIQPPLALRWSRLVGLIALKIQPRPTPDGPANRPRVSVREFRELLERIEDEARAHGAKLIAIAGAHQKNIDGSKPISDRTVYQREVVRFGKSLRLSRSGAPALVDGAALFQRLAEDHSVEEIFFDHVHPTRLGNAAIADALVSLIAPWLEAEQAP